MLGSHEMEDEAVQIARQAARSESISSTPAGTFGIVNRPCASGLTLRGAWPSTCHSTTVAGPT
jgi:hypothetical protein